MNRANLFVHALVAYSLHEHQAGHVSQIEVSVAGRRIRIADDGRGMGMERTVDGVPYVDRIMGQLVGPPGPVLLHGLGLSLLAALSPTLTLEVRRAGRRWRRIWSHGSAHGEGASAPDDGPTGTVLELELDPDLPEVDPAALEAHVRAIAAAHPELTITLRAPG